MAEQSDDRGLGPQEPSGREAVGSLGSTLETPKSYATYLKLIGNAKKAVAISVVVCGPGFAFCANRDEYLRLTLRQESGLWWWGAGAFGIGVLVCLVASVALVAEYLARPAPTRFALRSVLIRSLLILVAVAAVCFGMVFAYGAAQGIGAVIGVVLGLAAVREHHISRAVLAVLAAIVVGWTLLGTQSAYQYARWHADEIVAAGCELADRCPSTGYYTYNRHPELDTSGAHALFGEEVQPSDPRVPRVLRGLGARRIWVDEDRVAVYVGKNAFDFSTIPRPEAEFQIYRTPHPTTACNPVWGSQGKGSTHLTDRLWTNLY